MHPEIERLINIAREGDKITKRQKEIILRKAADLGDDVEEVEFILEGLMHPILRGQDSGPQTFKTPLRPNLETTVFSNQVTPVAEEEPSVIKPNAVVPETTIAHKRLFRDKSHSRLFGVCAGIADYFGVKPKIIRLVFVAIWVVQFYVLLYDGYGLLSILVLPLLYIVAGFILPDKNE